MRHMTVGLAFTLVTATAWAFGTAEEKPALKGFDPVELCASKEVAGLPSLDATVGRYRYLFASEANKAKFQSDPERWGIQWGGACGRMGPLSGRGSPDRWALLDGRIYIFASEGCRAGFLKNPAACFEEDDEAPAGSDEEARRGKELLARGIAATGGAEALAKVKTWHVERTWQHTERGQKYARAELLTCGGPGAFRAESRWDNSGWGHVVTPTEAFATSSSREPETLAPSQRRAAEREFARQLLTILQAADQPGFKVFDRGIVKVAGQPVAEIEVGFAGTATRLRLDQNSHLPHSLAYRGRGPRYGMGEMVVQFSNFRPVEGLRLPFTRHRIFDGKVLDEAGETDTLVQLNPPPKPDLFKRN